MSLGFQTVGGICCCLFPFTSIPSQQLDCLFSNMCALLYFYIFFCVFDTGSLWNCWTMNEIFLEIIFPIKSHYIPLTEIQGATSHQSMFRPHQPHCARHEIPFFLFSFLSKTYLYNKINKSTQL